jgi:hypothetical protein
MKFLGSSRRGAPLEGETMTSLRNLKSRMASIIASVGVSAAVVVTILMVSGAASAVAAAYGPHDKVTLCHNGHSITVSMNAQDAHVAHGDAIGPC